MAILAFKANRLTTTRPNKLQIKFAEARRKLGAFATTSWERTRLQVRLISDTPTSTTTDKVQPQEHAGKNNAPWAAAEYGPGQKQKGFEWLSDRISTFFILFMSTLYYLSGWVPKTWPNLKRIRTESTLAENILCKHIHTHTDIHKNIHTKENTS